MTLRVFFLLWLRISLIFGASYLLAETNAIVATDLHHGWSEAPGRYTAALEIRLAPGWKTYWRVPGEAGLAPQFDFSGSNNLQNVKLIWPAPIIFGPQDMWSLGYSGNVIFPIEVTASDPAQPVDLKLTASLGICEEICMPAELSFSALLSPDNQGRDLKIMAALANIPYSKTEANLKELKCKLAVIDDAVEVDVRLLLPSTGHKEIVIFEYSQPGHWIVMQRPTRNDESLAAKGLLYNETGKKSPVRLSDLNITVIGSDYTVDAGTCAP